MKGSNEMKLRECETGAPIVTVEVVGGVVQAVRFGGRPVPGLIVEVQDCDIEGTDDADDLARGYSVAQYVSDSFGNGVEI